MLSDVVLRSGITDLRHLGSIFVEMAVALGPADGEAEFEGLFVNVLAFDVDYTNGEHQFPLGGIISPSDLVALFNSNPV
jgi:hypothetical protein